MSNRSSKVSAKTLLHKDHLHFLPGRSETDKWDSVIKYSSLFWKVQVQAEAGGQYLRILKRNFGPKNNGTGPLTTQQWDDKSTQL